MTYGHLFFIPTILMVGIGIGFYLGGRAARSAAELHARKEAERAKVRAERLTRDANAQAPKTPSDS